MNLELAGGHLYSIEATNNNRIFSNRAISILLNEENQINDNQIKKSTQDNKTPSIQKQTSNKIRNVNNDKIVQNLKQNQDKKQDYLCKIEQLFKANEKFHIDISYLNDKIS